MQSNRHIFFRWTPRTARISFIYIAVVPAIIGYIGYKTDVSPTLSPELRLALSTVWNTQGAHILTP